MSEFINVNGKSLTFEEAQKVNDFMVHYNILRSWGRSHEEARDLASGKSRGSTGSANKDEN